MDNTLTTNRAMAIAEIIDAAHNTRKVAISSNRSAAGVVYGTARSITNGDGAFLNYTDDIRDGRLRVTTREGMEITFMMRDLIEIWMSGEAGVYDWSR